ncbi:DNA packaging protein [Candidatus Liberibacter solanacearum]|uniref:DNA packaging protein n=2 Tax=Candidatus Liberibacter solanacearum TaxID=556287 RepID=A0A1V2N6Y6_9HYPH|nr:DNA packaging protein [Candidatus Liberibacter solanacearum]ONI58995.1 DNA packaging protein [Candidatus Liberibacter solanacearum]
MNNYVKSFDLSKKNYSLSQILRIKMSVLQKLKKQREFRRLDFYRPYEQQKLFHQLGKIARERLFMAGNQLGKTLAGAAEAAIHLTGFYPSWWLGHRFVKPIVMVAGSVSYELTRDGIQRLLLGEPMSLDRQGSGMIPAHTIVNMTRRFNVAGAYTTVTIKHVSGGTSVLLLKAYEQGREKWQSNTVDYVWFDEEPPEDVYFEGLTRINATQGLVALTLTPLKGRSNIVEHYLSSSSPDRQVIRMTLEETPHYTAKERIRIINSYPLHEREARIKGEPVLGSGRIFPILEQDIVITSFDIPEHWSQIGGMDFGWHHPFAAVQLAWNRDSDVIYVVKNYRCREQTPLFHAAVLKSWGKWLPWAWPHDGLQHDKGSGEQLAVQYRQQGMKMLPECATFDDGSNGVEAGVSDILDRMRSGRWKVFSDCQEWLDEFRQYHRREGRIIKEKEDLICASRYGLMMKRFSVSRPICSSWKYTPRKVI